MLLPQDLIEMTIHRIVLLGLFLISHKQGLKDENEAKEKKQTNKQATRYIWNYEIELEEDEAQSFQSSQLHVGAID